MTGSALVSDPASVMRATGMVQAFAAHDDDHLNSVMEATLDGGDETALICTFGSLVWLAAALADRLARAGGSDVEHVLDSVIRSTDALERPRLPSTWQPE